MALKKKKEHHEEEMGEAWLLPYSDLMTLLLAVFIVLFAVSKMDESKAAEMAESFRGTMLTNGAGVLDNDGDSVIPLIPNGDNDMTNMNNSRTQMTQEQIEATYDQADLESLEEIQKDLEQYLDQQGIESSVTTYIDERGLVISLSNAILFDSGSADIKPENESVLTEIADSVKSLDNYIRIEGHTDNQAISTQIYPSNWELSCARAARVVRLFISNADISPERMVAVGYAEYKPAGDNDTPEGRALNRRIDIIVMNMKYNTLEQQLSEIPMIDQGDTVSAENAGEAENEGSTGNTVSE